MRIGPFLAAARRCPSTPGPARNKDRSIRVSLLDLLPPENSTINFNSLFYLELFISVSWNLIDYFPTKS